MKRMLSALILLFVFPLTNGSPLFSQSQFQRAIGGFSTDVAFSIIQTTDAGYAVAGANLGFSGTGRADFYVVKLDNARELEWANTVGTTEYIDVAASIVQTSDGGYAVGGSFLESPPGTRHMLVTKHDASGTLQWSVAMGGSGQDHYALIVETPDHGLAAAGCTNVSGAGMNDMYVVKLDEGGTFQWATTVGGAGQDFGRSITTTADGGLAVAGSTTSFGAGGADVYVAKFDASGNVQWTRTVGGAGDEFAYSIIQTPDGGFTVAGSTNSFGAGLEDMYIVRFDESGTLQWTRTAGGTASDVGRSIIMTPQGDYAVAGTTGSFGAGGTDMYVVNLDAGGTIQQSRTVGGTNIEEGNSIIAVGGGGYVLAGLTMSFGAGARDMFLVGFDNNWNTCSNSSKPKSKSGTGGTATSPTSQVGSPGSTVTVPALAVYSGGAMTLVCSRSGGGGGHGRNTMNRTATGEEETKVPREFSLEQNYPNPFNPSTNIVYKVAGTEFVELTVFDLLGRNVATLVNEVKNPGTYEVTFDASELASGVYLYRFHAGAFTETKKLVLMR